MEELHLRQKQILNYLLNTENFEPVKNFAAVLQCSTKTVRNDLSFLEEYGVVLEKIAGKGIRIVPAQKSAAKAFLERSNLSYDLSTEQRRVKILFDLLEGRKSRVSIQSLSDQYFVSKTSIVNDLRIIDEKLKEYHLHLKKDIKGTQLAGKETDIRKALVAMLNIIVSAKSLPLENETMRMDRETLIELENHFGKSNVTQAKAMIEKTEQFLNYKITDPYYINLVTHILFLIDRIKNGKTIYAESNMKDTCFDPLFYTASQKIADSIEAGFSLQINKEEVFYIYRYLMSSRGIVVEALHPEELNASNVYLQEIAEEMIRLSSAISSINFSFSSSLYNELLLHLKPMMNRIDYNIEIRNPLLQEIKSAFPELMVLLRLVTLNIRYRYKLGKISEDEISYIAVYFQTAVEEAISKKRILIVCSTGVGTSHLLEKRIKNHFPELEIVDVVSAKQIERMDSFDHIDLIVSTVKLNLSFNKAVAYVSALFNKKDEQKIREILVNQDFNEIGEVQSMAAIDELLAEDEVNQTNIDKEIDKVHLFDCVDINAHTKLYLYLKKDLAKARIGIQSSAQNKEKNKVKIILLLQENEGLTESVLKNLYHLIVNKNFGGYKNGSINSD